MDDPAILDRIVQNRQALLAELDRRQAVVRDFVRAVGLRSATGFYLFGRPGTAKTYTVRKVLDEEFRVPYVYQQGHLTPLGLFELLEENPDAVIVLDDLSSVFKSEVSLQVLLAALEHPTRSDRSRRVTYRRKDEARSVLFRGGIIGISNRELHDDELLAAFKSRVQTLNYNPSDAHLGALMLEIASGGWHAVPPGECLEVARFVIGELVRLGCRFDLRVLVNKALPVYRQWQGGRTECGWRDLVTASVEEQLAVARHAGGQLSRGARKEGEHALVRRILREHPTQEARVRAWVERTGKSERAFYRRLAEMR